MTPMISNTAEGGELASKAEVESSQKSTSASELSALELDAKMDGPILLSLIQSYC